MRLDEVQRRVREVGSQHDQIGRALARWWLCRDTLHTLLDHDISDDARQLIEAALEAERRWITQSSWQTLTAGYAAQRSIQMPVLTAEARASTICGVVAGMTAAAMGCPSTTYRVSAAAGVRPHGS